MKINKFIGAAACVLALSACSNNDDPDGGKVVVDDNGVKITVENLDKWTAYAKQVANLLHTDAEDLLNSWETSYEGGQPFATIFKTHNSNGYTSAESCLEEMIDGAADIANEVGTAKIGDPLELWLNGSKTEALYAVESWYSWHSRDDYSNNILSIRNAMYGTLDGKVSPNSIMALLQKEDAELAATLKKEIQAAYDDILAIPQPFRNNINSAEAKKAMETCATLEQTLSKSVKSFIEGLEGHEAEMQAIVDTFVDDVVLPTYNELEKRTATLLAEVNALAKNPTDAAFKEACAAWLDARQPWEESEAFLFGPVDALGLDPNMDSWPLDQTAIVNHINSGDFTDLNWGEGDSDDKVQAAQNIRGFHTLEFLLFENGQPRTMPK